MPAWKDTIRARPAIFRSAPFHVVTSERSGGRRDIKHEYPYREFPFFEDIGKVNVGFVVNGHVIGDNYLDLRDNLIAALEDSDEIGILQHPYYGRLNVKARKYRVSESALEGGMAIFSINFEEAAAPESVDVSVDSVSEDLSVAADDVQTTATDSFSDGFSVDGFSDYFVAEASSWVTDLGDYVSVGLQYVNQAIDYAQEAAQYVRDIGSLVNDATSLVRDPDSLANSISSLYTDVLGITDDAAELYDFFVSLIDFGENYAEMPQTTATRRSQLDNRNTIINTVRALSVANAARVAGLKKYESNDAAALDRDQLLAEIENIIVSTEDDNLFRDISKLIYPVTKIVSNTQREIVVINEPVAIPELVLSWRLYENAEQSIALRNGVVNPAFLLGELDVLSSV